MSEEPAEYKLPGDEPIIDKTGKEIGVLRRVVAAPLAPERGELFAALATAQGEIQAAEASQTNEHFDYSYANLQNCLDACRKPLADTNLAVIQLPTVHENGAVQVTTILGHSSGQWIESSLSLPVQTP